MDINNQTSQTDHHLLGQIVGLALLGFQAYAQQDAPGSGGPKVLLSPDVFIPYVQGVISLFHQQQQPKPQQ